MSFCGSIVSNDFPHFEGTQGSIIESYNHGIINQINSQYSPSPSHFLGLNCSLVSCFEFRFVGNQIENLNMFKRDAQALFDTHVNWQMQKLGLVVHLKNFKGDVLFEANLVKNVMYNFDDVCSLYDKQMSDDGEVYKLAYSKDWLAYANFYAPNKDTELNLLIPSQNHSLQLSSLIVIDNLHPSKSVSIKNNKFMDAQMINGLITVS